MVHLSSVLVYKQRMKCCGGLGEIDYKTTVIGYHVTLHVFGLGNVLLLYLFHCDDIPLTLIKVKGGFRSSRRKELNVNQKR